MLKITLPGRTFTLPNHLDAKVCVELAGGGCTPAQTVKAMLALDTLNATGTCKIGKSTITRTPEPENKA